MQAAMRARRLIECEALAKSTTASAAGRLNASQGKCSSKVVSFAKMSADSKTPPFLLSEISEKIPTACAL